MKKILIFTLLFLYIFCFSASASIGSKGLILEGGKEQLILKKGEKTYINVQDGFTNLPLFKNVSYYSDNTLVATVGLHSGILRANGIGNATISAISEEGHAGRIRVTVISGKLNPFWILIPLITLCFFIYLYVKR